MIRYRRSLDRQRYRLGFGEVIIQSLVRSSSPISRNPKPSGSGGSTSARLKLKGIDGMAPQGVEYAA